MTASLITRLAGPAAIAAGTLMVGAQLVLSTFDMSQHIATSTNPCSRWHRSSTCWASSP